MSKLILSIYQSFLVFYTFLDSAYIIFMAPFYRAAAIYYYFVLVVGLFIFNALIPYLGAVYTVLDLDEFCLETVLKI